MKESSTNPSDFRPAQERLALTQHERLNSHVPCYYIIMSLPWNGSNPSSQKKVDLILLGDPYRELMIQFCSSTT